jgi:uncharacterized membrane protein YhaH (DUF805 family)
MSESRMLLRLQSLSDWRYLFLSLDGRISRKPFWIGTGVMLLVTAILVAFVEFELIDPRPVIVLHFALLYPGFAVDVKRARDRDMSLMLPVVSLVLGALSYAVEFFGFTSANEPISLYDSFTIVNLVFGTYLLIVLGFFKGTPGPNRYGPDPLANRAA